MTDNDFIRRIVAPNPSPLTGAGTNTYLIGKGAEVAVVDPGPAIDAHLDAILAALLPGQRISHILVTHPHADHSALAPALARASAARMLGFGPAGSGLSPRMAALGAAADLGGGEGRDPGFVPDQQLAHGDVVAAADWQMTVWHCPGHMSEHICLDVGDTLLSGDHVMEWSTTLVSPPDGDMGAYMASLKMLQGGRWTRFLPGHGQPVSDPAARLEALIAHRRSRETAILAALTAGPQNLGTITARVYTDTPATLHPAAARNAFAHLVDLEEKGHVAAAPALTPDAIFGLR